MGRKYEKNDEPSSDKGGYKRRENPRSRPGLTGTNSSAGEAKRGDGRRIPRVEREILQIVSTYLLHGFKGKLPGFVSVTRVVLSGDLRTAKALVTLMGLEDSDQPAQAIRNTKKSMIKELQTHAWEVQHQVNRRLQMKNSPKITFLYDEGFENAMKIENILRNLNKPVAGTAAAATTPQEKPAGPSLESSDED